MDNLTNNQNNNDMISKVSKNDIQTLRAKEEALEYLNNLKNDAYFLKQCEKYKNMIKDDK